MRKFLLLLAFAAFGIMHSQAREVTLSEATRIAASQGNTSKSAKAMVKSLGSPVLAYTEFADGRPLYYIFNRPGKGFIIIAADDKASTVLAYSDTHPFTTIEAVPENMKAWLDSYATLIRQAIDSPTARAPRRIARAAISPLLTTQWGQEEPFNALCPLVNMREPTESKTQTNAVTGCVGTAMAQVMKYYQYPEASQGTITYDWKRRDTGESVGMNITFDGHTYDWANMLDKYKDITTEQSQKDAVALLVSDCSYSVEAQFDEQGTAAATMLVPYAMETYFGYDRAMDYEERDFYADEDWENMIYAELESRRPVMYCGTTASGSSHTWIIDGADENGLFHINWGWEGFEDGYFALTGAEILNPEAGGTGGASFREGFILNQACVVGIRPNEGGEPALDFTSNAPEVLDVTELARPVVITPATPADQMWLTLSGRFLNSSTYGVNVYCDFGLKLRNRSTGNEMLIQMPFMNNAPVLVEAWKGLLGISIPRSDLNLLANGEYDVIPVYRDYSVFENGGDVTMTPNGGWKEFRHTVGAPPAAILKLTGEAPDLYIEQELENVVPTVNCLEFKMTLHANADVSGYIVPMIFESADDSPNPVAGFYAWNDRVKAKNIPLEMAAGETRQISLGPWVYDVEQGQTPWLFAKMYFAHLSTAVWNASNELLPQLKNQCVFHATAATAISQVQQSRLTATPDIFTIDGRHMGKSSLRTSLKPGMYIIDGRKVIVK